MKFTDVENCSPFSSAVESRTCIIRLMAYPNHEEETQELGACGYVIEPIYTEGLLKQMVDALDKWTP